MEKTFVLCVVCGKEAHAVFADRHEGKCVKCAKAPVSRERVDMAEVFAVVDEITAEQRMMTRRFVPCATTGCKHTVNREFAKQSSGYCVKCVGSTQSKRVRTVHICTRCNTNQVYNLKFGQVCVPCRE